MMWLVCLFRGHRWLLIGRRSYEGNLDEGPILYEPPADYSTLLCTRCKRSWERDNCDWFNQHGVDTDDVESAV